MSEPRGIRNNNPLNIRLSNDKWQGQVLPQRGSGEGAFCVFYNMEYGWRAAFRILTNTYYNKYKLRTIRAIVSRWAPNNENNTAAYIRHVSDYTGIGPDKVLASPGECPTDWLLIGYAMAVVENGKALPAVPMLKGFSLAMSQ
ncbi:MAG: hypothetical protein J6P55_04950 [Bacteroidaceae bacterium]|nr:hypothetical protein [Bacteroidaceae bacterium]